MSANAKTFKPLIIIGILLVLGNGFLAADVDENSREGAAQMPPNQPVQDYTDAFQKGFEDTCAIPFIFLQGCQDTLLSSSETLSAFRPAKRKLEEQYGIGLGITLDNHYHQIIDGDMNRQGRYLFWWNVTLTKELWDGAVLVTKARGSNTDGNPANGVTPLVGSGLNIDWSAYETELIYLANFYIEQKLMDDRLLLAVGKITFPCYFDTNRVAGWDFFSHSLARNQAFPHVYHTVGALARYNLSDCLYVQAGITDKGRRSETGLNTFFDGESNFLTMFELGVRQQFFGREGNYRLNIWHDSQPQRRHDGNGSENDTVGFGLNFDQQLTDKTGAFFRYGFDDGRVRKFSHYWSTGFTHQGPLPGREEDVLGFGVGQGLAHRDYRQANNTSHSETIFETYYKIAMSQWASLTLDFQTLLNPGINASNDTTHLGGVRFKLTF